MSSRARTRTERPNGIRTVDTATVKIIIMVHTEATGRKMESTSRGATAAAAAQPRVTEAKPPMAASRGGSPRLIDHRCHLTRGRIGRPSGPTAIIRCPQGRAPCARRRINSDPSATATSDRSMTAGSGGTGKVGTPDAYNRSLRADLAAPEYGSYSEP